MLKMAINKNNPSVLFKYTGTVDVEVAGNKTFGVKKMYQGYIYDGNTEEQVLLDAASFDGEWLGVGGVALAKVLDTTTEALDVDIKPENIKAGVVIFDVTGTVVELVGEETTATATTSAQTITPSTGKNGITKITLNAVTASIDENIATGNIKSGVTILGVAGSSTVVDVSDTDATAADVASGKYFYAADGTKTAGTAE